MYKKETAQEEQFKLVKVDNMFIKAIREPKEYSSSVKFLVTSEQHNVPTFLTH